MTTVSRELIRAVLETRDRRHNETHAALVAMFQALSAELIAAGIVQAVPLAERLSDARDKVAEDANGASARAMLDHVAAWIAQLPAEPPIPGGPRWFPPPVDYDGERVPPK
jgi:hypothetical protein